MEISTDSRWNRSFGWILKDAAQSDETGSCDEGDSGKETQNEAEARHQGRIETHGEVSLPQPGKTGGCGTLQPGADGQMWLATALTVQVGFDLSRA